MGPVHTIEKQLEPLFKDLPALPKSAKELLVQWWPYIALIFGVFQVFAVIGLFGLVSMTSSLVNYANQASYLATGHVVYSGLDITLAYAGIALLAVDAVILLIAFAPLKKKLKKGWDLIFLASLINLVYAVAQIFMAGRGFGSFLMSLVGTAIGFYLLYQIRDSYTQKTKAKKA